MKILKNTTASPISISDFGITIPASGSYTVVEQDYLLLSSSIEILTLVGTGDIVVNDGTSDLNVAEGIRYITYPNQLIIQEDDSVVSRYIKNLNFSENLTVTDDGNGKISIDANIPVVGNLSKMFQGIDTVGGLQVTNVPQVIEFDTVTIKDSYFGHSTSTNPGEVEILSDGWYRISAIITVETIDASLGVRGNPRLHFDINKDDGNGWVQQPDNMGGYIRENGAGKLASSITGVGLFELEAGWKIRITVLDSVPAEPNEATVAYSNRLIIEYIDRTGSASGSVDNLSDVGDVTAPAPNDGEVLVYDGDTSTWISQELPPPNLAAPDNIVYVSKNGSDTTGDGTYHNPYLTIKFACDSITGSSVSNRYAIIVSPGVYTENNPIQCPSYTTIEGFSNVSVRVVASNVNSNLFNLANNVELKGLSLNGTTGASLVYGNTVNEISLMADVTLSNALYGVKIDNGLCLIRNASLVPVGTGSVGTAFYIQGSGFLKCIVLTILGAEVGTVAYSTGSSNVLNIEETYCNSTNVDEFVCINNGSQGFIDSITLYGVNKGICTDNAECVATTLYIRDCTLGAEVDNGGELSIFSSDIDATTGISLNNASTLEATAVDLHYCETNIEMLDSDSSVYFSGGELDQDSLAFPTLAKGVGYFVDRKVGDESISMYGQLTVGRADLGSKSAFGEGNSYTRGMNVLTSDNTASSTTDGGNLTDVSEAATYVDSTYFSFQGTTANHCIYISSDVQNKAFTPTLDYARLTGIKSLQNIAAVEATAKSFVVEYWNGTTWVGAPIMAQSTIKKFVYSNYVFIRANSEENIHFGAELILNSVKKTINSKERHWYRVRIINNLTTAPTFEQWQVSNNRAEISENGTLSFHGAARYTQSLSFQANTFGETGGVTDSKFDVGSGGIPTGWTHTMKNNQLNGNGDAIYATGALPEGICTSCPITVKVKYLVLNSGTSSDGVLKISFLPVETIGVEVTDPSGGIPTIPRTIAMTETLTSKVADTVSVDIDLSTSNKIITAESEFFKIDNYYEGDLFFLRIELDDDGDANKNISILGVDIEGVRWSLGAKLRIGAGGV